MPEYIEREALRAEALRLTKQTEFPFDNCFPYWQFSKCIKEAPAADVETVRHGEWTQDGGFDKDDNVYTCSACGEPWILDAGTPGDNNMNYCPNCGAKMDGERKEAT